MGRIVSFLMGISYWRPVRLSVMESVSRRFAEAASAEAVLDSGFVGLI
jgi:hypothetical protein